MLRACLVVLVALLAGCTGGEDPVAPSSMPTEGSTTPTPASPTPSSPTPSSRTPSSPTRQASPTPATAPPMEEQELYERVFNHLSTSADGFEYTFAVPEGARNMSIEVSFAAFEAVASPQLEEIEVVLVEPDGVEHRCTMQESPDCYEFREPWPAPSPGEWRVRFGGRGSYETSVRVVALVPTA